MASEVVCGLVFRLLLPVCLAAGEFLLFTHVTLVNLSDTFNVFDINSADIRTVCLMFTVKYLKLKSGHLNAENVIYFAGGCSLSQLVNWFHLLKPPLCT